MDNVLRLIIVEDNLNDAEMMISTIKGAGFAVRADRAVTSDELETLLKKHTPDLVICSLKVPGLSLEQTITGIRDAGRSAPVIAVTDTDADVIDCMQLGAADLVRKNQTEHLKLVVSRTATCQSQWRQLKQLESALRETDRRCKTLLQSSRDAIAYVHEGMHIFANESYLELFGYAGLDDVEGTPIMDMVAPNDQNKMKDFLRNYAKGKEQKQELDITLRDTHDKEFKANIEFSPATIDGEPCTQILIRDQANAKELEQQLNYLSQRDLLTGLFNRQHFIEQLGSKVGAAGQGQGNTALVEIVIDKFEDIKGIVGVSGSDLVIADVGKTLAQSANEGDLVARMDGPNFAIITRHWEKDALSAYMTKLLKAVTDSIFEVEGKSITCTISSGAAIIDENTPDANELVARAEAARAEAAQGDGGKSVIYQPKAGEMTQKQIDEQWGEVIREALKDNRLRLLYQPIVSLHGDPGERYEVYLRLLDKDGNAVSPNDFLPSAERTNMAKGLDRWVLINALKKLAERRKTHPDTIFFIKLTAGSLQDPGALPWVAEKLKEARLPAESLVLEMKEETILKYLKQAKEFVNGLKQIKCAFALDDFGAGLDPFQLLKHVNADYLKIDRGFMQNITGNQENQDTVKSLTDTAHTHNKLIVAQFVEDPNALSVLWGMGVNYIQGSFLQDPSEELNYDFSSMG
ncbi:MAG TPA: EAL domain-containing protein [Thioalkalivibrio sp.]|nr:EAL domain-containing protein [Thioalkalivibrio sp.]